MNKFYQSTICILLFILSSEAFASRLEEAAQRGQSVVLSLSQATAVIGIALGGLGMSVGMVNLGRTVLVGGVVGAAATFGGPALISTLHEVFR